MLPLLRGLVRRLPDAPATLAVVYLGIFPAAIGYVSWAYVLPRMPVARTATFLYFVPAITTAGDLVAILGVGLVNARAARGLKANECGRSLADDFDEHSLEEAAESTYHSAEAV